MRNIVDYVTGIVPIGGIESGTQLPIGGSAPDRVHFLNEKDPARIEPSARIERRVLETLATTGSPAYVEVDDNDKVSRVRIPAVGTVTGIFDRPDGDLSVRLDASAKVFRIASDRSDLDDALARLNHSMQNKQPLALVTSVRSDRVLFVRNAPPQVVEKLATTATTGAGTIDLAPVSLDFLLEVLTPILASQSCRIPPEGDCIPFLYVRDGCAARAHRLCQRLIEKNVCVGKVFALPPDGKLLFVRTPLSTCCHVEWFFHTAPLVEIDGAGRHVIDPSLFLDGPAVVPLQTWLAKMDGVLMHRETIATIYDIGTLGSGRLENPPIDTQKLSESEQELANRIADLLLLANDGIPGPPYDFCAR